MITFLCSPKPFTGQNAINQLNALRSWRALDYGVEIIVFGNVPGAAEATEQVQATHVPEIECSNTGAPLFNGMVDYASRNARHEVHVYVNCDILLTHSVVEGCLLARDAFSRFLLVGERLDLQPNVAVNVDNSTWYHHMLELSSSGALTSRGPCAVDYFAFPRGLWTNLLPVYMGRARCDQALLHHCFRNAIPVIDGSRYIAAIHQYHDYSHVSGGKSEVYLGQDYALMSELHGLRYSLLTIADAQWYLSAAGEVQVSRRASLLRRLELSLRYKYQLPRISLLARALQYWHGKQGVQPVPLGKNEIDLFLSHPA